MEYIETNKWIKTKKYVKTLWLNGKASDSGSGDSGFESQQGCVAFYLKERKLRWYKYTNWNSTIEVDSSSNDIDNTLYKLFVYLLLI